MRILVLDLDVVSRIVWLFYSSSSLLADFEVVQEDSVFFFAVEYYFEVVEDGVIEAWALHCPAEAGLYCAEFDVSCLAFS